MKRSPSLSHLNRRAGRAVQRRQNLHPSPKQTVFFSEYDLLKIYQDLESRCRETIQEIKKVYTENVIKKEVDGSFRKICLNQENDQNKPKQRFKEILNSRIYRGPEAYQYIGSMIELDSILLQMKCNSLAFFNSAAQGYEKAVRVTLVYFNPFSGRDEKIPTFTTLFSGKDAQTGQTIHTFYSQINPSFWDVTTVFYDKIIPLGCVTQTPRLVRSNGNFFLEEEISLQTLKTTFYKDDLSTNPNDLYKNISSGLLVLYVWTNFYENQSSVEELEFSCNYRLKFLDE